MSKRKTREQFIIEAVAVHGDKYCYSKVVYKSCGTKIIITCKKHGDFFQLPDNHVRGKNGCPECAGYVLKTKQQFVTEARKIHGDKYDYSGVEYQNANTKVIIYCKKHGNFEQTPANHTGRKTGCPHCSGNAPKTTSQFIVEAYKIHGNKYDYSKVKYKNAYTKIIINCFKHGAFEQTPASHLNIQTGCPYCANRVSKSEQEWLFCLGILNDKQHRQVKLKINKKCFKPDGFDPVNNIIYEFYGDYWHGNPVKYNSQDINQRADTTFGELYQNTLDKEELLKSAGYKIISIWETNYNIIMHNMKNIMTNCKISKKSTFIKKINKVGEALQKISI